MNTDLVDAQLPPVVRFEVPDMFSCRSMGAIGKSIKQLDFEATVVIDILHHRVDIVSEAANEAALSRAIARAGFTAIALPAPGTLRQSVDILLP